MPNRIIKESICTSEKIASLSDFEFRLWVGLITQVDDAGRGDARPAIIKGRVFPFRERLSIKDIDAALQALAAKGCVALYKVDGRPYFWFPGWAKHQRIRDCKPKYPGPPENDESFGFAATCGELRQPASSCGKLRPESNPNPNPNPNAEGSAEAASGSTPVITLPLNDKTDYPVSEEQCQEWAGLYPAVDVIQQLREMRGWLLSNPTKRKTRRGVQAFVTRWLAKEQDKGGAASPRKSKGPQSGYYGGTDDDAGKIEGDLDWMERYLEAKKQNERENEP